MWASPRSRSRKPSPRATPRTDAGPQALAARDTVHPLTPRGFEDPRCAAAGVLSYEASRLRGAPSSWPARPYAVIPTSGRPTLHLPGAPRPRRNPQGICPPPRRGPGSTPGTPPAGRPPHPPRGRARIPPWRGGAPPPQEVREEEGSPASRSWEVPVRSLGPRWRSRAGPPSPSGARTLSCARTRPHRSRGRGGTAAGASAAGPRALRRPCQPPSHGAGKGSGTG